jgi:hypothetical protein
VRQFENRKKKFIIEVNRNRRQLSEVCSWEYPNS